MEAPARSHDDPAKLATSKVLSQLVKCKPTKRTPHSKITPGPEEQVTHQGLQET